MAGKADPGRKVYHVAWELLTQGDYETVEGLGEFEVPVQASQRGLRTVDRMRHTKIISIHIKPYLDKS